MALAKGRPDDFKPIPAKDVELVKKTTIKGPPSWAGGGKDKKKDEQAATGISGDCFSGQKYAIVIGISEYPGDANDLEYCDDDARAVENTLLEVYEFDNVITLMDEGATASAIESAINTIGDSAGSDDEVVFFFSGHGAKGRANDGDKEKIDEAIVSHDGDNLVYIWDGHLKDLFSDFETSRIIFVFDTCLAGGMTDLAAEGRVINMASTERGYSYEGDTWEHGEFTYYFIVHGMYMGEADVFDHDGDNTTGQNFDVAVEEAFDYAKENCIYDKPTIRDNFDDDLLLNFKCSE
ncbi:MAG TPA: caspase family protein [Dehalococcoidia bacterium]|nr:caspase family protein [Dehalococcoidia bacterium]